MGLSFGFVMHPRNADGSLSMIHPMSLGFYAACAGAGMIAGSLTVTLGVLFIIVPVHLINLKYFEERELELRYGNSYVDYRRRVPFLIPRFKHT